MSELVLTGPDVAQCISALRTKVRHWTDAARYMPGIGHKDRLFILKEVDEAQALADRLESAAWGETAVHVRGAG